MAPSERYTGSGIVNEEEMVKNREMESAPSLSDAVSQFNINVFDDFFTLRL